MPETEPIPRFTFYDIDGTTETKAWSPSTWKTRFVLNMKKVPYTTTWLELPDINAELSSQGIKHTTVKWDQPFYTCPAIIDHSPSSKSTDRSDELRVKLSDTLTIAKYLEKEYPDPPLFPHGTLELQLAYTELWWKKLLQSSKLLMIPIQEALGPLCPRSQEYYRETRERMWGKKIEDLLPEGPERDAEIEKARLVFDELDKSFERTRMSASEGYLILEGFTTWADIWFASWLTWFKIISPEQLWDKHMAKWNDGRWETFVSAMVSKYGRIDKE